MKTCSKTYPHSHSKHELRTETRDGEILSPRERADCLIAGHVHKYPNVSPEHIREVIEATILTAQQAFITSAPSRTWDWIPREEFPWPIR